MFVYIDCWFYCGRGARNHVLTSCALRAISPHFQKGGWQLLLSALGVLVAASELWSLRRSSVCCSWQSWQQRALPCGPYRGSSLVLLVEGAAAIEATDMVRAQPYHHPPNPAPWAAEPVVGLVWLCFGSEGLVSRCAGPTLVGRLPPRCCTPAVLPELLRELRVLQGLAHGEAIVHEIMPSFTGSRRRSR